VFTSESSVAHVRPKGKNAEDKLLAPQGTMFGKNAFGLTAAILETL